MNIIRLSIFLSLLFVGVATGQVVPRLEIKQEDFFVESDEPPRPRVKGSPVGKDSGLWDWVLDAEHHRSVVKVAGSGGLGTGVLIAVNEDKPFRDGREGYVLTAWHVVQDDITNNSIKIIYRNERKAKGCRVAQYDEAMDIAILWVWAPNDIEPVLIAEESIVRGDSLEFAGFGGGTEVIRTFASTASAPSTDDKIFADVPLLPGDSGGPVFNSNHQVVGIISGGWFWWNGNLNTRITWPARASNVGPIRRLMQKIR